ncbi:MAG: FimV/HubP family polar landmark protein, partial [Gammaproteobacteria bacterium]
GGGGRGRPPGGAHPPPPLGAGAPSASAAVGDREAADLRDRVDVLEEELAESRRLIELRDRELQALQNRLAAGEQEIIPGIGEAVTEEPVTEIPPEPEIEAPPVEETVAEEPAPIEAVRPDVVTTSPREEPSLLGGLFTSIWLYVGLGGALLVAFFIARRRAASPAAPPWSRLDKADAGLGEETVETTQQLSAKPAADTSFVVEESPAERTDQDQVPFATAGGDEFSTDQDIPETPLEQTISADSPVNLDEADPIAEADFHMAYGLYDQAADLLSNSLTAEPERKDLRLKLLEVYFIWENQGGFLREAQVLQARLDDPADPDWNKVLIMGKQICPDEELFAAPAAAAGVTAEMDFALTDDDGSAGRGSVDIDFSDTASDVDGAFDEQSDELDLDLTAEELGTADAGDGGLDLDISEAEEATQLGDDEDVSDGPTMETPTIESEALETTMETPTIESEALETTMETPTIESQVGKWDDESAARPVGDEQTAEIDLDDLGLDLSDLEPEETGEEGVPIGAAGEVDEEDDEQGEATGVDFAAETLQVEIDSLESLDDDTQRHKLPPEEFPVDEGLADLVDVEATGEMPNLGDTAEQPMIGDTVEQPDMAGGDTAEHPSLAAVENVAEDELVEPGDVSADVDFNVGDAFTDSDDTTSVVPATVGDGATMTEVGTKLDLARAYIDMGDPDGARSILNEVLEEASDDQSQEARKLLDDLDD